MRWHRSLIVVALALATAMLVACGGSSDSGAGNDVTPTVAATLAPQTPGQQAGPNEIGQAPIFMRTADGFQSLTVDVEYKVIFRINNGYADATLPVSSEPDQGGQPVVVNATKVEPQGNDLPGSYYSATLVFPQAGPWAITVTAGEGELTVPVTVQAASGG